MQHRRFPSVQCSCSEKRKPEIRLPDETSTMISIIVRKMLRLSDPATTIPESNASETSTSQCNSKSTLSQARIY